MPASPPPDDAGTRSLRAPRLEVRRGLFVVLTAGTAVAGSLLMLDILRAGGVSLLEVVILALFAATFCWIGIAFWNAVAGALLEALGRDPLTLRRVPCGGTGRGPAVTRPGGAMRAAGHAGETPIAGRTALVMPVHNEEPARVRDGIIATLSSLLATGEAAAFDFHLLSDTTDPALARQEESVWKALRERFAGQVEMHYRRRADNAGRKAGNVAELCSRCGHRYEYLLVLDADSVMEGSTLVELVRTMDANPGVGLVQTVPVPSRQESLFGRLLQFAACLYGPILARGQSFWQGDTANYWGHNAVVRMRPFIEHCRLPVLPGEPPLGGEILSHDFVEAALLRRAGWHVVLLPTLGGSFEQVPGTLPDYARRDRRWCQGSLQHLRLLATPGLRVVSRLHFLLGAMGYVSSLLWLAMLGASTVYVGLSVASLDTWIARQHPLPAAWALPGGARTGSLLAVTALLLFMPRLLALGLALARRRDAFGGAGRLLASALLEMVFAVTVAPVMMMFHSRFVISVLAGRTIEWGAQRRGGRDLGWGAAARSTWWITAVGVAWAGLTLWLSPLFLAWLTPIFVGLLLAVPLVRWTSSRSLGRRSRHRGLFLSPSEDAAPRATAVVSAPVPVDAGL